MAIEKDIPFETVDTFDGMIDDADLEKIREIEELRDRMEQDRARLRELLKSQVSQETPKEKKAL